MATIRKIAVIVALTLGIAACGQTEPVGPPTSTAAGQYSPAQREYLRYVYENTGNDDVRVLIYASNQVCDSYRSTGDMWTARQTLGDYPGANTITAAAISSLCPHGNAI